MSTEPDDESARMPTCRSCGNRVARDARRCPACGSREPTGAMPPPDPAPGPALPPSSTQRVALGAAFVGGVLTGMAVTAAVFVFVLRPVPSPSLIQGESAPSVAPIPAPASNPEAAPTSSTPLSPAAEPAPASPAVRSRSEPSRSRGRADWLFFFKTGDQLVRMGDDAVLGMVIRTVPRHVFPDGTTGPAYVLQLPDGGGQRVVDADELERGGRLQ
jgi:hypothetical protein